MSSPKDGPGPVPHVEVPDATAAFHKLEDAARRIVAAPKAEVPKHLSTPRRKPGRPKKQ